MPGFALPRPMAFAGCCAIAVLNARTGAVVSAIADIGLQNAIFNLFEISAVIWFAIYAALSIAVSEDEGQPYQPGDRWVLALLVTAILLPLPVVSVGAGFGAGLWLLWTAKPHAPGWRLAVILFALAAQHIFGRLFLALFSEYILAGDIFLVDALSGVESYGNVLKRADGSEVIIAAGCSSIANISYALLAWVVVAQLFKLRLDRRLGYYALASVLAIFGLNSLRLLSMAWFPDHFHFLHDGFGAALFGWSGFLILAVLAAVAVLDIGLKQKAE